MMNKLENQIQTNREGFDIHEPSEGHMERFMEKLKPSQVSFYARIPYGLKAAVVLLLVAVSSILIYEQAKTHYVSQYKSNEKNFPGDFGEAELYYTSLINDKSSEIKQLILSEPAQEEMLMNELQDMDRMFHDLQKDLQTHPSDERILSAMIEHYQLKLEIMGAIVQQLENVNQINSTYKSHENTEI